MTVCRAEQRPGWAGREGGGQGKAGWRREWLVCALSRVLSRLSTQPSMASLACWGDCGTGLGEEERSRRGLVVFHPPIQTLHRERDTEKWWEQLIHKQVHKLRWSEVLVILQNCELMTQWHLCFKSQCAATDQKCFNYIYIGVYRRKPASQPSGRIFFSTWLTGQHLVW